jgi:hypothetical protein
MTTFSFVNSVLWNAAVAAAMAILVWILATVPIIRRRPGLRDGNAGGDGPGDGAGMATAPRVAAWGAQRKAAQSPGRRRRQDDGAGIAASGMRRGGECPAAAAVRQVFATRLVRKTVLCRSSQPPTRSAPP